MSTVLALTGASPIADNFNREKETYEPMATGWARIAYYLAPRDPMAAWYREALEHAGIRAERLGEWTPSELSRTHVLLLCGFGSLSSAQAEGIRTWVENGGCLVVSGGTWGLESLLGHLEGTARHVSVGYSKPIKPDRLWPEDAPRAKSFGATTVRTSTAIDVAVIGDASVVTRVRSSKGHAIFVGFHLGQTFTQMALGRSVEVDGIGASDGSARLDDGVLRAEDGHVLDFDDDRVTVEGGLAPFFGEAHADIVREVWLRALFESVDNSDHSAAALWVWPNNANAVATLAVDVLEFEVDHVINLQRILTMFGCPAAWLVSMPGFAADVYRVLRAMEHEVGLLFHIDDANGWHEDRLKIQLTNLSRLASWPYMGTVRVEDGQWRGWTKFYDACETAGARVSLNKMGRQPGTSGFLFGTCHPFFPARTDGKESMVCELPGHIWQPGLITSEQVAVSLVNRVDARQGCLQIGLHPSSLSEGSLSMALKHVLSACKERRFSFLKPDAISKFERGRRQLRVTQKRLGESDLLQVSSETALSGLTVMVSGPCRVARDRHRNLEVLTVERYGTTFSAVTLDVPSRVLTDIEWLVSPTASRRAA